MRDLLEWHEGVLNHHKHLKLALSLQICMKNIYRGGDRICQVPSLQVDHCTTQDEIKLFLKNWSPLQQVGHKWKVKGWRGGEGVPASTAYKYYTIVPIIDVYNQKNLKKHMFEELNQLFVRFLK